MHLQEMSFVLMLLFATKHLEANHQIPQKSFLSIFSFLVTTESLKKLMNHFDFFWQLMKVSIYNIDTLA